MKQDTIASKVGRPPKFKTPEELKEKAEGYFQYCDTHPIEVWQRKSAAANQTAKNGSGVKSDEGTMYIRKPYTFDGLALWCGIGNWYQWKSDAPETFRSIITALEARVRDQQVSGAMVGMYNANLVARLNGIAEKTESKQEINGSLNVKTEDEYAGLPIESQKRIAKVILEERHKHYQQTHDKE